MVAEVVLVDEKPPDQDGMARHVIDARVRSREAVAVDVRVLRVEFPSVKMKIRSGMFCMLRRGDAAFPFLNRPFSILDLTDDGTGRVCGMSFLVKEVGLGSRLVAATRVGDPIRVIGPLGCGFPDPGSEGEILLVAGGAGIVPLYLRWRELAVVKARSRPVVLLYGARDVGHLYLRERLEREGLNCRFATEDGSYGTTGRIDRLLDVELRDPGNAVAQVLACGPEPMLRVVSDQVGDRGVACFLSLETHMGCGFGVCNGCAVKVRDETRSVGYRYDRACREGPVFAHESLLWD